MEPPAPPAVDGRVTDVQTAAGPAAGVPLEITGYHGAPTPASPLMVRFDRARRLRRAVAGLLAFWGAMVVGLFIPIAHFVLVPALFAAGIYQFVRRLKVREVLQGVHGACPDCGAEQDFESGARLALPQALRCRHCRRGLTLAAAAGRGGAA
jgi:hypothetical protein